MRKKKWDLESFSHLVRANLHHLKQNINTITRGGEIILIKHLLYGEILEIKCQLFCLASDVLLTNKGLAICATRETEATCLNKPHEIAEFSPIICVIILYLFVAFLKIYINTPFDKYILIL
jgi:hypothetical protein